MLKDREEEARAVLSRLVTPEECEKAIAEIHESLAEHHSGKLFSFGGPLIIIGVLLAVFQQFVGINVVLYYAPEIFKGMGLSTSASLLQTILVGGVNMTFTLVAILTVDKLGRKPLQIIGALIMAASMIALGADLMLHDKGTKALICMLVYVAGFAMSWGPVVWILLSEIFPNQIRGKAMALCVAAMWIFAHRLGRAELTERFGYEEFLKLWSQPEKLEGLLVFDDVVARGAITAIREKQVRVPEDLKLVLSKSESIDLFCPMPATFVVTSERDMARVLIEQVQKQFCGESCERILLPFQLAAHINPEK